MTKEQLLNDSMRVLDKFVNNYKSNNMDDKDKYLYSLLNEIIVIELSSITKEIIYIQLKENYFQTDLATSLFILKLYTKKEDTLLDYIDIYLEQIVENSINIEDMNQKIDSMRNFISNNIPSLLDTYNIKVSQYRKQYAA